MDDVTIVEESPRFVPPLVHGIALFTTLRSIEAVLWPEPFAKERYWRDTFTKPPLFDPSKRAFEWDGDRWYINVIGHGLMGSELYLRARVCGFGALGSFAWAAGASAVWEYGFEGNAVRPSALDLVWTPMSGALFGELRYRVVRGTTGVVRAIFDPFGEIEHFVTGHGCGRHAKVTL